MRPISESKLPSSKLMALLRRPLFWIMVVGLLAMGGALRADFYMDDYAFIVNSKGDAPTQFRWSLMGQHYGSTALDAVDTSVFQLIPTCLTLLTNWLFPLNSSAAHGWNLLIHLTLSVLVFRLGERFLRRLTLLGSAAARRHAALAGALIFACHPLATEPVHYAKCHMVGLVALFGFWATCEAAEFLAAPTRRRGLRCLLAVLLCILSYFPGTVMLGFNLGALVLFTLTGKGRQHFTRHLPAAAAWRRPPAVAALSLAAAGVLYVGYYFLGRFYQTVTYWDGLFPVHVATQGRVFWEYVQRILVPVGLVSDHYQPWSTFRDPAAVVKLALFGLLLLGTALLAFRKGSAARRGLSLMLLLALIPFAMRLLYVNIEIMVEYRAYNALPWICLLAGCGFAALTARLPYPRLRWAPAAALIAVFTILSAQRSAVWRSGAALAENVLAHYPLNSRARTQLQSFDIDAGNYAAVLRRHDEVLATRDRINVLNAATRGKVLIDPIRADSNVIGSYQFAVYARAELEGCLKALVFADDSIASLKTMLPGSFLAKPGETVTPAWPLLEARSTVARAQAAGYTGAGVPAAP